MAKRAISIMLTEPADRKPIEHFIALALEEQRRASAVAKDLEKRSVAIITNLAAKHGIDPAVELYVDTSLHANHNLLFLASIGYAADDVPSSAGMVLN